MEIIKPKKERKFLKAMGDIAFTLFRELVLGIGKKVINKVGNKRQGLVIAFALVAGISYASIDSIPYPITGNKQRLGWQTSGNGLVYRGRAADTITKPSSYVDKNVKAYLLVDSVLGTIFVWRQTYWDSIKVNTRLMPFDSITFNTAKNGTVGVGEVEYNDTQGSLIQGLKGGNVTNVIGQQLHQRVNNRTGAPLAKGDVVYLAGSQGNRITVAKGLAVSDAFSANTFGVVAESIADNASGFIITEGLITGLNTSALTEDSAVYLSPTVPGALTSTKPQAPQHTVYIGVCVKSNNGSGELFVKIRNGQELDELHDTRITNPVTGATLYFSGGLWRDTTAALLVSDTASMLSNYATKAYADTTGRFYARQDFSNVSSSTLTWTQSDTLIPGGVTVVQVYRNGQILLPSQYTIPTSTSVVIAASSFKVNDNYTVIFPRSGGVGSGGGSGSLTSISAGTGITVTPNPITTTGVVSADLSVLMELTDTSLLNLTTRFASKLNTTDTASLSNRIDAKGNGTVISVGNGYGLLSTQSPITTSGVIRVDSNTVYNYVRDSIVKVRIGNDTIKILKQEYNNVTTDTLTWTTTNKFPIQLRAFILLFRNGQLLINDQYSVIDTNKIKIAATSYKVGENYTLVTVSGIGSADVSQTGNPVYPEAGIALSTGTTWTTSITNNSSNWNIAFTDRLKWDGGSTGLTPSTGRTSLGGTTIGQSMFTLTNPSTISFPRFNADNTVTSRSAANFRTDIGAGTVTSVNVAAGTPLSIQNNTTIPEISMSAATGSINGYLTSTDWTTFNNKQSALSNASASVSGILTSTDWNTFNNKQNALSNASSTVSGILTSTDWNTFNNKQNALSNASSTVSGILTSTDWTTFNNKENTITAGTTGQYFRGDKTFQTLDKSAVGLSNVDNTSDANKPVSTATQTALNLKVNISDTASMLTPYFRDADTTSLNLTSRFNTKLNISDTLNMLVPYLRKADTTNMLLPYFRDADTTLLNLTSRFATKLNISDTASMLTPYLRKLDTTSLSNRINLKVNISDTLNMLVPYLRKADTTNMLLPYFRDADTTSLNLTSRFNTKQNTLSGTGFVKASGISITYDNSTYLTTGTAASTYLPLTGGTLTGGLTGTTGTFTGLNVNNSSESILGLQPGDNNYASRIQFKHFGTIRQEIIKPNSTANLQFRSYPTGTATGGYEFYVSNGSLESLAATIGTDKSLAVTGNITEAGNNVLTNLDTASLSSRIDGKVSLNGDETINGSKSFNNVVNVLNRITISGSVEGGNQLLGKNSSNNYVSDITLGTGLSITSNVLNVAIPTERYYFDLGIVAGAADNSASTYDFTYGSNIFIVPTSLNGYCIDSVYIRAIGCSTCPPVAGDKDYYVGVYKANAGSRVATSGATLVGSQITMNEYDLNEVNRNDVLSTGEAWWVYLNGTYNSDLAYVTAGFIVKKTCN